MQNLIEVGNKLRAKLLMATGGEDASPLEKEIRFDLKTASSFKNLTHLISNIAAFLSRRLQEETEELNRYCAATKRNWTKMQNVLIKAHINMVPTEELEGFRLPGEGLEPAAKKSFWGSKIGRRQ